MSIFKKQDRSI